MSPTITIRISQTEKETLESDARKTDQTVSDYVRETLNLRRDEPTFARELKRVDENCMALVQTCQAIFQRLERLEALAGIPPK